VRVTFIAKGRCLSVVSETRKVPFRARHSINRSPPKRKPVIGILAIAALASSAAINVAVAQQGPATERVEPTPLAGGVALSRRRSRCNNTIASRDRTRRTYAASRRWPRYAAVANRDSPSRATVTLRERRYNGNAYRYGDRGGRYYDGRSYAVRSGITTTTTPITRMAATITRHTARIATRCVASIRTMAGAHVASMCATSDILRTQ
jgi:hypothetical protein